MRNGHPVFIKHDKFKEMETDNRKAMEVIMSLRNYSKHDLLKIPFWEFYEILNEVQREIKERERRMKEGQRK